MRKQVHLILTGIILLQGIHDAWAQTPSNHAYGFLALPTSSRIAAMGGDYLTIRDGDIALCAVNPSLITPEIQNNLSLSFVNYYDGINYGNVMYGHNFGKAGMFLGTLQYINYGTFQSIDMNGMGSGNYTGGEYAFNVGWGRQLAPKLSLGATARVIYSSLEAYNSFGVAVDVAANYHPDDDLNFSMIVRNAGRQIKAYVPGNIESLPFEIQLGMAGKLKHLPLCYSILLDHLEQWNLAFSNDLSAQGSNITAPKKSAAGNFADKALRHVVLGAELNPAKFLSLRLGYNYGRRQMMKVESHAGTVGFSWGIGLKVNKLNISYSRVTYHLAGSPDFITITTNLGDWKQKHENKQDGE